MASLTPGILSKLLQNVGNKDVRVTGEHRSPLLQVIEIVPSLPGGGDDGHPWQSRGFFLKVSDSLHSAYVSISDEDVDLIYSDKIQLGQFVHISRLDSSGGSSPVPVVRGIKPVPKRRPCVGNPKDLVSSDLLPIKQCGFDFSKKKKEKEGLNRLKRLDVKKPNKANRLVVEEAKSRRTSFGGNGNGNGRIDGLELRRLSLDSTRRAWDHTPSPNAARSASLPRIKSKVASTSPSHSIASVVSDRKASSPRNLSQNRSNLTVSPLKTKNEILPLKSYSRLLKEHSKSSSGGTIPSHLTKLPLNFRSWFNWKTSWELLPPTLRELGKGAVSCRNVAFLAAVNALEEASATEAVIQCMSMFAELCESSQNDSSGPVVEQFLNIHQSMQKAARVIDALTNTGLDEVKATTPGSQCLLPEAFKLANKNSTTWVQAAVETNLSKFCLFRKQGKMEILNGEKCHYVILDSTPKENLSMDHSTQNKKSPRSVHGGFSSEGRSKGMQPPTPRRPSVTNKMNTEEWSKGSGLKEAACLAEKLILASREWFLKYLEDSLDNGFRLRAEGGNNENACLLGQLKRVNQWLDDSVGDGNEAGDRIERLKKKLFGFLLEHVDSNAASK